MSWDVQARASAAAAHISTLWQAQIDAVGKDRTLTAAQRKALVSMLRQRQQLDAKQARKRIIDEEKDRLKAARRNRGGRGTATRAPRPS